MLNNNNDLSDIAGEIVFWYGGEGADKTCL